jgi:hypothetical protein
MDNFNYTLQCPNFTGTITFPGSSSVDSSGNLNLGSTAKITFGGSGAQFKIADGLSGDADSRWLLSNGTATHVALRLIANNSNYFSIDAVQANNSGVQKNLILNINGGNVGIGTSSPAQALEVNGQVKIDVFASAASAAVCQNGNVLSSCSSSIRYKESVKDAPFGLNDVLKMRPVTFKWKGRDENDLGLIAEEVEKIDPLLVTYKDGKIEGVKYPQLTAVLANAIKELASATRQLKTANEEQAVEIGRLHNEIADMKVQFVHSTQSTSEQVVTHASAGGR